MEVQEIIRGGGFASFDGQVLRIDGTCVRPYAVTDTRKLSVEVAEGAEGRLVLLHAAPGPRRTSRADRGRGRWPNRP